MATATGNQSASPGGKKCDGRHPGKSRDNRIAFFVRALPLGKHNLSYRLRAEITGKFSALPEKGSGMYAPELHANNDEMKIGVED